MRRPDKEQAEKSRANLCCAATRAGRTAAVALLMLLAVPLLAAAGTLLPFTTDGCSRFPDGTWTQPDRWRQCCLDHDLAYWRGGSYAERLSADQTLQACLKSNGEPEIGALMLLGVRIGGSPWWPTPFRWGYGWPYLRAYQPLTPEEKELVLGRLLTDDVQPPSAWTQEALPVPSAVVRNWFQVAPGLYRSAQPTAAGFREIAGHGITTVLNLRVFHNDERAAAGNDLELVRVPMQAFSVGDDEVIAALRVIRQAPGPVLVHCLHGADRTGTIIAMYRIVEQGWEKEAAIAEMTGGGFGFHAVFNNLPDYVRRADIERIRAALAEPPSNGSKAAARAQ